MKLLAIELGLTIHKYEEKLKCIDEKDFSYKPAPNKWSKKEELGHLIDSAHNNLRRFIVAQHEINPKIVYRQNDWVTASNYNAQHASDLILLWCLLNKQICEVIRSMPMKAQGRMCDTGTDQRELHSLKWIAEDYLIHLKHHMHHILELQPVAYSDM
jgi:hypothetical protein